MRRERTNEVKHTAKEREKFQKIAATFFKEGEMLKDLQENQIFKFDLNRDYFKIATAPDRFRKHTTNKLKVRF
jgi:hypothetical protein